MQTEMARPPFKVTTMMRQRVSVAAGAGMSHEEISIALGISRNTLQKYFRTELSVGSLQRRMEIVQSLYGAAKKGNVSAAKAYLSFTPTAAVPPPGVGERTRSTQKVDALPVAPVADPESVQPKPMILGKKEQAQADAVTAAAGTEWDGLLPSMGPTALQ
jgi:hypothetical protein